MKIEEIIIGKTYFLDLGSLAPVEVEVLEKINEEEILVAYKNSWPDRQEVLTIELF